MIGNKQHWFNTVWTSVAICMSVVVQDQVSWTNLNGPNRAKYHANDTVYGAGYI